MRRQIEQQCTWIHDIEGARGDYAEYRDPFTFLAGTRCVWVRHDVNNRQIKVPRYGGYLGEKQRNILQPSIKRFIEPGLSVLTVWRNEDWWD